MRISDWSSDVCSSDLDFLASGILVDVTGDNADDARSKGWREAQRKGWAQLYRRLNGTDGPALGDSVLDGIVTSIVVEDEQIGPRRYVAKLGVQFDRSEEHTSELQSLMRISYAVFCLKIKPTNQFHSTCSATTLTVLITHTPALL